MRLDWKRVKRIGRALERAPLTMQEITVRAGVSQRTAYRWIQALENEGCMVVRLRRTGGGFVFRITSAPRKFFG